MKDLNEFLAVEVMGWEHKEANPPVGPGKYWFDDGKAILAIHGSFVWNPQENIEQAMMVLRQCDNRGWEIFAEGDVIKVIVFGDNSEDYEVYAREEANGSLELAICIAAAKATGWEDE